jgi:hypothetical protein
MKAEEDEYRMWEYEQEVLSQIFDDPVCAKAVYRK